MKRYVGLFCAFAFLSQSAYGQSGPGQPLATPRKESLKWIEGKTDQFSYYLYPRDGEFAEVLIPAYAERYAKEAVEREGRCPRGIEILDGIELIHNSRIVGFALNGRCRPEP